MTTLTKIQWKIPILNPDAIEAWNFYRAFSNWIPESPEIFIDVADYRHVHDGPLIALIGYNVDYYLDECDGILGLLYSARRVSAANDEEALATTLKAALAACDRLSADPLFAGELRFERKSPTLILNDRALASSHLQTETRIAPFLQNLAKTILHNDAAVWQRHTDSRRRFQLTFS